MRKQVRRVKASLGNLLPDSIYAVLVNAKSTAKNYAFKMELAAGGLFEISDARQTIYISQRSRHGRYKHGIDFRTNRLADQYFINQPQISPGGVFIDCGANVGELGLWAQSKQLEYHAFEPEEREARCCDLNNFQGQRLTNRMGLWDTTGNIKLYSKPSSADSSLIEISGYSEIKTVPVITLDDYVRQRGISAIEVLKVEAEGAEPEVLRGAQNSLSLCRYVTIDCGPERGLTSANTVREVSNHLYERGFRIVQFETTRIAILFARASKAARLAA